MDTTSRLRSWTPRLAFLAFLAVLLLVGVIQYQWFSRSAAVEIEGTLRGLEGGLRQSVFREFQRYAPIAAQFETLQEDKHLSEAEIRSFLDRLWATYGPKGTSPHLISSLGYAIDRFPPQERTLDHPDWGTGTGPLPGEDAATFHQGRGPGEMVFFLAFDTSGFFADYVFPSLLEQFPGAQLGWAEPAPGPPPEGDSFNSRTYTFSPFSALLSGASVPRTLQVGVPRLAEFSFRDSRLRARTEAPGRGPLVGNLQVTLPSDAPVLGIERRLAWNWLGSTLLLLFLGAAFVIVLGQSGRLATLRRREREFVASVSHELRTPLTVIRSAADNFTRGIVAPERQSQYGQLILDQSLRLGRMIEQMLSFAHAESGTIVAKVQAPMVFAPWLADLRPPLEAMATARQVQLTWDVAGVPRSGLTDPEGLRLILENLVVNAVNHAYPPVGIGDPRPVRITLRHLVPDRLELTVDDDGRGISPKEAKKVFEPFYRDQVSRDKQEKGSGLGLFLARHQARKLGGDLKLESPWRRLDGTRRSGCRFALTVPFRSEEVSHGW